MVDIRQQADGSWIEQRPTECPNGHPWRKGDFTAASTGGHGTRYWTCKTCHAVIRDADLLKR
jgi:hypothetical protein